MSDSKPRPTVAFDIFDRFRPVNVQVRSYVRECTRDPRVEIEIRRYRAISSESFREIAGRRRDVVRRGRRVCSRRPRRRVRGRGQSPKAEPAGRRPAPPRRRRARDRARGSGRGARWRRHVHGRATGNARETFRAVEGRAPPAAHFAFAPAFAPSANIETPRRTEWPRGGVGRHRGIYWPAVVCCLLAIRFVI